MNQQFRFRVLLFILVVHSQSSFAQNYSYVNLNQGQRNGFMSTVCFGYSPYYRIQSNANEEHQAPLSNEESTTFSLVEDKNLAGTDSILAGSSQVDYVKILFERISLSSDQKEIQAQLVGKAVFRIQLAVEQAAQESYAKQFPRNTFDSLNQQKINQSITTAANAAANAAQLEAKNILQQILVAEIKAYFETIRDKQEQTANTTLTFDKQMQQATQALQRNIAKMAAVIKAINY